MAYQWWHHRGEWWRSGFVCLAPLLELLLIEHKLLRIDQRPQDVLIRRLLVLGVLAEVRQRRVRALAAGSNARYAALNAIYEELEIASRLYRRLGCPVIDVSDIAIEEARARLHMRLASQYRRQAEYHALMGRKYKASAARPWLPIEPDSPEPAL